MSVDYLKTLIAREEKLSKQIIKVMEGTFPVGTTVSFEKWGGFIDAEVLDHSDCWWSDPSLKVRNLRTQKEYWVDLSYLLK